MPEEIIRSVMMNLDYEAIYEFLEKYRKKRPEWDDYRSKIPEPLLEKWGLVLKACRENGFIYPITRDGKILFSQIQTHDRINVDNCTLCTNSIIAGTCKGRIKYIEGKKTFVFCWVAR